MTACSSSSSSASGTKTTSTTSSASSLLGPSKPATGTPVKIGFVSDGKSQAVDNSSEIPAAKATATYVNEHLGGLGGHPIEIDGCETALTPAGATDCANQMITDKVAAVLVNQSGEASSIYTGVSAGGIPFVAHEVADQNVLTGKNSYVLTNALADFVGPAKVAQDGGAKRAAVIVINVPGTVGPLNSIGKIFYKNAGVALDIVAVPPGTPDMTSQVQAELSKGPDQIQVIGDESFCTSALKAMKTLGFSKTVVVISQCITATSAQSIPGGYAGMKVVTVTSSDPADADLQLFHAVMSTYSSGTEISFATPGAYATVLGFARATSALTGDVTPASVEAAMAAMSPQRQPLGAGSTFQCNGKQITYTPPVCSTAVLVATLDSSGQPTGGFTALDVSSLLKLT